jgi:hypothetical protein
MFWTWVQPGIGPKLKSPYGACHGSHDSRAAGVRQTAKPRQANLGMHRDLRGCHAQVHESAGRRPPAGSGHGHGGAAAATGTAARAAEAPPGQAATHSRLWRRPSRPGGITARR